MQQLPANSNKVNPSFPVVQTSLASLLVAELLMHKMIYNVLNEKQCFNTILLLPNGYIISIFDWFVLFLIIFLIINFFSKSRDIAWMKNEEFGWDSGMTSNLTEIIATYSSHFY